MSVREICVCTETERRVGRPFQGCPAHNAAKEPVTAPDARQSDELREALSHETGSHAFRWVQQHPGWLARCSCREWEEPVTDGSQATDIHRRWRLHAADALLPMVTAWAEKQGRERAAAELRKAAVAIYHGQGVLGTESSADWLQDRAAALAADAPSDRPPDLERAADAPSGVAPAADDRTDPA